ncbi:hypothetical protein BGW80DRAFT_733399 [Lactifluus volemus]|nr:hypothetical protein BGW80DRAFT_733399 [Lactifluus volemus]
MSQSYHHLQKTPLRSTNTTQPASAGLVVPISQATMGENIYAERSRVNDEAENLSTETGNPVLFSPGDGDGWSQEGQDELIPGFNGMDPEMRRVALNQYLRTPKYTYENILREFWQQQQTQILQENQRKAAEQEAKEREMRMLAEQHRQIARPDGQGMQPRRY